MKTVSLIRYTLAGAGSLFTLFVLCWLATAIGDLRLSHMFIELFTAQPVASGAALLEGLVFALVFGAASGFLVALNLNLFGFVERS
jgi:hypothetical protein